MGYRIKQAENEVSEIEGRHNVQLSSPPPPPVHRSEETGLHNPLRPVQNKFW